ncbi:uncharacterized protein LOC100205340 [Hydra vulgaris]|uniref:uncharacterized protein LOC100205340 n=1 Tax=Hydra vulgaris TaxID=6087 RepID=UPI001F5F6718|nr:uncharacterized protein LOC100205340 [Hydra vulgaris]
MNIMEVYNKYLKLHFEIHHLKKDAYQSIKEQFFQKMNDLKGPPCNNENVPMDYQYFFFRPKDFSLENVAYDEKSTDDLIKRADKIKETIMFLENMDLNETNAFLKNFESSLCKNGELNTPKLKKKRKNYQTQTKLNYLREDELQISDLVSRRYDKYDEKVLDD